MLSRFLGWLACSALCGFVLFLAFGSALPAVKPGKAPEVKSKGDAAPVGGPSAVRVAESDPIRPRTVPGR